MSTDDPVRNPDGTLTVPGRAEAPDGTIGDGMITIGPDDPRYAAWDSYLARTEETAALLGNDPGETISEQLGAGAAMPGTIGAQLVDLVGPKGYEHGWKYVGGPGLPSADGRAAAAKAARAAVPWHAEGDVAHYHGHLGIDRKDMPQLSGTLAGGRYAPSSEMIPKFIRYLGDRGVKVSSERVPARSLRPTQTTGSMRSIRQMADSLKSGEMRDTKPVFVSADGHVLDGHHNWAGRLLAGSEGGRPGLGDGMPVRRADLPIGDLLAAANDFGAQEGISKRATGVTANPALRHLDNPAAREPRDTLEKHALPDGTLTPERAALHQQIINGILAGHEPQENPVATFLGGGPAAGKSTILADDAGKTSAIIDSDDIKGHLPEYREMLAAGDPRAASYVHEESSRISKAAMAEAQRRRVSYTLDGTGDSDIDKMAGKVSAAKRAGYTTEGRYVTVDTDTAVKRAMARAAQTGRMVPEPTIRTTHRAVSDTYGKLAKMGTFDRSQLWDTSGTTPLLVAHKELGGQHTVDDPEAYQRFLAKRHES